MRDRSIVLEYKTHMPPLLSQKRFIVSSMFLDRPLRIELTIVGDSLHRNASIAPGSDPCYHSMHER